MPPFFFKKKKEAEADRRRDSSGSEKDAQGRSQASAKGDSNSRRGSRRVSRPHPSLSSSSGVEDDPRKPESLTGRDDGEPCHGSSYSMPPLSGGSSSSRLGFLRASSEEGSGVLAVASVRRTSIAKGGPQSLPRLTSAQSLPTGKAAQEASLTPTTNSAPSGAVKRFSVHGGSGSSSSGNTKGTAGADLVPMKRLSASDGAPTSLQPRRTSNTSSAGGSVLLGKASPSPGSPQLARPLRIATDVTTADSRRVKSAAEVANASTSTSTTHSLGSTASPSGKSPTPLFTAMESVAKRPGSSFRLQKRRKGSQDSNVTPGVPPALAARGNNSNSFSLNSGSVSAVSAGATGAGGGGPSAASAFDTTRKERQANGGGSSHGRRSEPVASFATAADAEAALQQSRPGASVFSVPLPPPMSSDALEPPVSKSPSRRTSSHSHHRSGSVHSAASGADDRDSQEPTPSIRKSRRSSMRLQTLHSAGSLRNTSLSSNDDLPRPLTRHASTLSSGQREALKRTPSFLSRTHTPPPCDLRESVQLRRVRRPSLSEGVPSNTPLSSNNNTQRSSAIKADTSFSSESTVLFSGLFPPPPQPEERRITSGSRRVNSHPTGTSASERDSTLTSASTSMFLASVRPASRAPRTGTSTTPEPNITAIVPTPPPNLAAMSSGSSTTTAYLQPPASRPPSARSAQQRLRQDLLSSGKANPSYSLSPEPVGSGRTAAGGVRPPSSTPTLTGANSDATAAAAAATAAPYPTSNASAFSSEAELFDYYGSFMLTAPNFDRSGTSGRSIPSAAADESAAVTAGGTKAPGGSKRGPDATAAAVAARLTRTPSSESKRNGMGSGSFTSEPASLGDVIPDASPPLSERTRGTTPATKSRREPTSPAGPASSNHNGPLSDPVRGVRPAGRHRQVNTYVDEDDGSGIFQVASDTAAGGSGSVERVQTSSSAKTETAASGYDYMLDSGSSLKYSPGLGGERGSPSALLTPSPTNRTATTPTPVPAKRLITHPLPASVAVSVASAMSKLSSSDDDDDDGDEDEDDEGLLEGFRPALFDAARKKRRGSSIIFYLDRKDSLSSLDVVVKPGGDDGRGAATVLISPVASKKVPPLPQQTQSEYSMLKLSGHSPVYGGLAKDGSGSAAATASSEAVARPRVTMEPYVPLGSTRATFHPVPPTTSSAAATASSSPHSRLDGHASKSYSLLMDPYGLMDGSSTSLQASVPRLTHRGSLTRAASEKAVPEGPRSIFVGTTSRFAPDPEKMHRPLANTFGYTAAQRRARAAALATGVTAEAWAAAAGIDLDSENAEDDGGEGNGYAEVYTDENGDEWYWEEVEEGEEGEYGEEEEGEEETEEEVDEEGKLAVHRVNVPLSTSV